MVTLTKSEIEKAASSKTLSKCIKELKSIKNKKLPIGGPLRNQYNETLTRALEKIAKSWYLLGFKRCHKIISSSSRVQKTVKKKMVMKAKYFSGPIKTSLQSKI